MKIIEAIQKLLQIAFLVLLLSLVGTLVMAPDAFGKRAKTVFVALAKHELDLSIGPSGPTVSYSPPEAEAAFEAQTTIDTVVAKTPCLRELTCTKQEQSVLADLLGIDPAAKKKDASVTDADLTWAIIFGSFLSDEPAFERLNETLKYGLNYEFYVVLTDSGYYAATAFFGSKEEAENGLVRIGETVASDAYIRLTSRWCETISIETTEPRLLNCLQS